MKKMVKPWNKDDLFQKKDPRDTYPHSDAEIAFRRALDKCLEGNHKPDKLGYCVVCGIDLTSNRT